MEQGRNDQILMVTGIWITLNQWLFYTPLVWGNCVLWGRYRGSRGCAPSGSRGRAPGQGVWGRSPQKLKAFCFTFFSEARAEIKRFDRF